MIGRFAPSPTGRMHMGNVVGALLSWLSARSQGGRWLLRIEDVDRGRSRRQAAWQIMDDLMWLGLPWDGTPVWQSRRSGAYAAALATLQAQGLVYPCYCTRADLHAASAPHANDGRVIYNGHCRPLLTPNSSLLTDEAPHSLRLLVPHRVVAFTDGHYGPQAMNLATEVGDYIIRRRDGGWAYQLAVVVDDAQSHITEVVRGADLLSSTPQQIHLHRLLGYQPPRYVHYPLLVNAQGVRLSKRDGAIDMGSLRQRYTAPQLLGRLAALLHLQQQPTPRTATELLSLFAWQRIPKQPIVL